MNVQEVAQTLGITPGAVRDAVARGRLQAIRQAGTAKKAGYLLVDREEVERYRREVLGTRGRYERRKKDEGDT